MSAGFKCTTQPVLVNGNLVIHDFPKELRCVRGEYIVYLIVNHNQAWFWKIFPNKVSAVAAASSMNGHVIQVDTFERN